MSTTSIMDLPTDPVNGGSVGGNINMVTTEIATNKQIGDNNSISLDQSTISQIVNSLQQVSNTGATSLPSRDIPQSTENITQDVSVQPNYIPPPEVIDYINDINEDVIDRVFEPYFTTKHKAQGTGIGLYMSSEIITKHMRGYIFAHNVEFKYKDIDFKGAEFVITLPLSE